MHIQLHRPDAAAAAVSETDLATVGWRRKEDSHLQVLNRTYYLVC